MQKQRENMFCRGKWEREVTNNNNDNRVNVATSETLSINVIFYGFSRIHPILKFTFEKEQFS
jgi:hypothetical protein